MPQDDQSELAVVNLEMPEGTSLEETERISLEMSRKIEKIDGVRRRRSADARASWIASRWPTSRFC